VVPDPAGNGIAVSEYSAGQAAGDGLAADEEIRGESVNPGVATMTRRQGVRFVDGEQHIVPGAACAQGLEKAGLRQHHAGIGHHRLGEHAGDVAACQCLFHGSQVVELDHRSRGARIMHGPDLPGPRQRGAIGAHDHHGLVDTAVVAAIEHQHLRPARGHARQAQHGAVGIGGGLRDLPPGQAEQRRQPLADFRHQLRRQHGGEPLPCLRGDRAGYRRR
jgi:hypothetical protein